MKKGTKLHTFLVSVLLVLVASPGCKTTQKSDLDTLYFKDDDMFEAFWPDTYILDAIPHYDEAGKVQYICAYYGNRNGSTLNEDAPLVEQTIEKFDVYANGDVTWRSGPIDPVAFEKHMGDLADGISWNRLVGSGLVVVAGAVIVGATTSVTAPVVLPATLGGLTVVGNATTATGLAGGVATGFLTGVGAIPGITKSFPATLEKDSYKAGLMDPTVTQRFNKWKNFNRALEDIKNLPTVPTSGNGEPCEHPGVIRERLVAHHSLSSLVETRTRKSFVFEVSATEVYHVVEEGGQDVEDKRLVFYLHTADDVIRAAEIGSPAELRDAMLRTDFMQRLEVLRIKNEDGELTEEEKDELVHFQANVGPLLQAITSFWSPEDKTQILTANRLSRRAAPKLYERLLEYLESKFRFEGEFRMEHHR